MNPVQRCLAMLPVCACLALSAIGAVHESPPTIQEVNTALQAQDYAKMETLCREILREDSTNAQGWFLLGYALHAQGELDEAILAHITATSYPQTAPLAYYNLGCAQALKGHPDQAFAALDQAVGLGINNPGQYRADSDLKSLHSDARWERLMGSMATRAPASASSNASAKNLTPATAMHFWVGKWDVYSAKSGKLAGHNTLSFRVNDLVIHERWESTGDSYTGESWNHYDHIAKAWRQTWVGSRGDVTQFLEDTSSDAEGMMLVGKLFDPNKGEGFSLHKMHVRPIGEGRVRQTGWESTDDGATWVVQYDLIYVPKGESFGLEDLGV